MSVEICAAGAPLVGSSPALPADTGLPLQANSQVGRGQFATLDASGNAALNSGTTPGQIAAGVGYITYISDQSSIAGKARSDFWQGLWSTPASTIANDGFTQADMAVPFYIASESAPGKLAVYSGNSRSIGGLVLGLGTDGNPVLYVGPIAQLLARSAVELNAKALAWYTIADAAANTATTERTIPHEQLGGLVTSIVFNGAAVAGDNTDYAVITVAKRDGAGGAAVTLGTYDTRLTGNGTITSFVDASFTLTATLADRRLLATDIVTITVTKGGAGKPLTGAILVNGKVAL